MRRIVLLAVWQCMGLTAFCQAPVNGSAPVQSLFDSTLSPTAHGMRFETPLCDNRRADRNQPETQSNPSPILNAPCLDPRVFSLHAQNNLHAPPLPGGKWPHAKSIPIPTQWPDAKFEPIPTDWPKLKMLLIAKPEATPKPAK